MFRHLHSFLIAPSGSMRYRQRACGGLVRSKGVAFTCLKYMSLKSQGIAWNSSQGAKTSPSYSIWEERNILKILIVYIILENLYCLNILPFSLGGELYVT